MTHSQTSRTGWTNRAAALAGALLVFATAGAASGQCRGGFDGDGYEDLAIGVPYEEVNGKDRAGAVNVLYGGPTFLAPAGARKPKAFDVRGARAPPTRAPRLYYSWPAAGRR